MTTAPTSVVVIGAGLGGLTTALSLAPLPVTVLSTGPIGTEAASDLAQGGIAAAIGPDDSPALHALDTMAAGDGLCDLEAVRSITAAAPQAIEWLSRLGARFDHHNGELKLGLEGAHSRNRIVHATGDGTGHEVLRAAVERVRATPSITVLEHARAESLLRDDHGRVVGVMVRRHGDRSGLGAACVVLATGGVGGLFARTTNPLGARGQGVAMAVRAGADVRDLELVQFHPTALDAGGDPLALVSEAVRGAGAILVDGSGTALTQDPLAPRDQVARILFAHEQSGGRAYLDARAALGGRFDAAFPGVARLCRTAGIDPARELIPVTPAAHYHMGGVVTDLSGRTSVDGLWAVGEVAATGLHGANRLASNSLLEAVVLGRRAGHAIAEAAPFAPDRIQQMPTSFPVLAGADLQRLRQAATDHLGVLRDADGLNRLLSLTRHDHQDLTRTDEEVLLGLMAAGALRRGQSCGAHSRTDTSRSGERTLAASAAA